MIPKGAGVIGRKAFIDGRDWTAAHKAEVLFQLGLFDENLYGQINQVRKARNQAAHNGQCSDWSICLLAAELVVQSQTLMGRIDLESGGLNVQLLEACQRQQLAHRRLSRRWTRSRI